MIKSPAEYRVAMQSRVLRQEQDTLRRHILFHLARFQREFRSRQIFRTFRAKAGLHTGAIARKNFAHRLQELHPSLKELHP